MKADIEYFYFWVWLVSLPATDAIHSPSWVDGNSTVSPPPPLLFYPLRGSKAVSVPPLLWQVPRGHDYAGIPIVVLVCVKDDFNRPGLEHGGLRW